MSKVIASTYEVLEKLGAGGGGVVYLANHLRLNKKVVIKIDKRSIATDRELLRREVDVLKNLSHTYIPQVYDYFVEDEAVCTVMDFVPGESLDKPLKRGERFSQPQVVEWACQILEALDYLHNVDHGTENVGYVHGDIKPANIMRKPDNSICLIDFNIALALGETSVIGCSPGYASPEHYGESFSSDDLTNGAYSGNSRSLGKMLGRKQRDDVKENENNSNEAAKPKDNKTELLNKAQAITGNEITELLFSADKTEPLSDSQTTINLFDDASWLSLRKDAGSATKLIDADKAAQAVADMPQRNAFADSGKSGESVTSVPKTITPGVQSDIYSLGATLYHLLSGEKPPRDARQVVPLSYDLVSPQISDIISKAMNPDITQRYQSAAEMLEAFRNLRKNDKRVIRFKKTRKYVVSGLTVLLAAGIVTSFIGLTRIKTTEKWLKTAEQSLNAYKDGDINRAFDLAMETFPSRKGLLTPKYTASGQYALTNALGAYDLSDGFKNHGRVEISSAPFDIKISPNGKTLACVYENAASVIDLEKSKPIKTMPASNSALGEIVYVNDDVVAYAGDKGLTAYNFSSDQILWQGKQATSVSVSANGKIIAAVYRDEAFARIYDAETGDILQTVDFGGKKQSVVVNDVFANPRDNLLALNSDGSMLAVGFDDGTLMIYDLASSDEDDDLELFDSTSGYSHFEGGFYSDYFALSATGNKKTTFSVIDTKRKIATGGAIFDNYVGVQADETGVYMSNGNAFVKIDPQTGDQTPLINAMESVEHYSRSSKFTAVSSGKNIILFNKNAGKISEAQSENQIDFVCVSNEYAVFAGHDAQYISIMKYEENKQKDEVRYNPLIKHDEARISADGKTVMLFNYSQFTLTDVNGNVKKTVEIPNPEQVYDQQYRRKDGKSYLEVTYNNGVIYRYDAVSGEKLGEDKTDEVNKSLDETFYTDKFRIDAPLHGTPKVYYKDSGKLVAELQTDSYLTYVTQIGDNMVAQYRNTDGYYYGQLLNEKCEVIADLPYLCDVYNGEVYFDYPEGVIRKSEVYNLDELLTLAKETKTEV